MVTPTVPSADRLKAVRAVEEHGNISAAARALEMDRTTLRRHYRLGLEDGLQLSEGAQTAIRGAGLSGMEAKRGWRVVADKATGSRDSTYWEAPKESAEDIAERIRAAFESLKPAAPVVRTGAAKREDILAFLPHADWHLGMVVNEQQTGKDYNRRVAVDTILAGTERCIASQPPCETAIIMNAGDLLHANDDADVTPRNKHKLKVEGTHHQNFETAVETTVGLIDMALSWHGSVEYRAIPGNHDPNIPGPLSVALRAYYRQEPRVKIVVDENKFYQRNFGVNFIAAHHGDGRNPKELAAGLPGRFPEEWGKAKHWHFFTAHCHHHKSDTFGHVRWFQLPSVCSLDTHAADLNYGGNAGLRAITFHKANGLETDFTVNL